MTWHLMCLLFSSGDHKVWECVLHILCWELLHCDWGKSEVTWPLIVTTHPHVAGDQGVSHPQPPLLSQLWSHWSLWSLHSSGQEMCRGEENSQLKQTHDFQCCQVPVHKKVCNKEPVEVGNVLLLFVAHITLLKYFRAAKRCPRRSLLPGRSAIRSLSRWTIS